MIIYCIAKSQNVLEIKFSALCSLWCFNNNYGTRFATNFSVFFFQNTVNEQSLEIVIQWADLINCILVNNEWNLHWLADDIQSCTCSCSKELYCYLNWKAFATIIFLFTLIELHVNIWSTKCPRCNTVLLIHPHWGASNTVELVTSW